MIKKSMLTRAIFMIILFTAYSSFAEDNAFHQISGSICVGKAQSAVYIFLIEEADMKTQASGFKTLLVYPSSENIAYKFENVPEGEYAVRIFQDSDGNKKLNRGIFGPTEPWALSWKEGVNTKKIPDFSDISFSLSSDLILDFDLTSD